MSTRLSRETVRRFKEIDRAQRPGKFVRRAVRDWERASGIRCGNCPSTAVFWMAPTSRQVRLLCAHFGEFPEIAAYIRDKLDHATTRQTTVRECYECGELLNLRWARNDTQAEPSYRLQGESERRH